VKHAEIQIISLQRAILNQWYKKYNWHSK